MNLDRIAEEISHLDFSEVDPDDTDEAIYLLAKDIYEATDKQADQIMNICMDKYIHNIK